MTLWLLLLLPVPDAATAPKALVEGSAQVQLQGQALVQEQGASAQARRSLEGQILIQRPAQGQSHGQALVQWPQFAATQL